MKALARNILNAASAVVPFGLAKQVFGDRLLLPFYHLVSDEDVAHVKHLYRYRRVAEFEADLEFFLRHFAPLSLADVLAGQAARQPGFHLTFDDGFREIHDVIAPILKRKGIPATFFLNSAFLDNRELFYKNKASLLAEKGHAVGVVTYAQRGRLDELATAAGIDCRDYLATQRPYLTTEQVRSLIAGGFTIGAHSIDHPLYSEIGLDEQLRQTTESMAVLVERFGLTYRVFAFPFNDRGVSRAFFNRADVALAFGGDGLRRELGNPRSLQRLWMEGHALTAERKLSMEAMKHVVLTGLGRATIQRRPQ